ncbi:type II toxin-antitoxin system RelE/ParE family toxin [Mannheimia varigena]|uniref:type II toxin-antitoxin system RelE/ParE family toxin n=1 Tax=Mannheimia varigena TaxID=85404 RepID=UPI00110748A7|nr:type II toxin-antitoxin system RelE/ParE family toxin [Mannheimia varigena]TLU75024.1 type II toxin-antitoxin system RelE/ParE family toxin [Mannheimia varigena]
MYKLSVQALKELEKLFRYSISQFGIRQTEAYFEDLKHILSLLAEFPTMGISMEHIRNGLRAHTHQSHTIYYRIKKDHIFIVRILHNQMDHKRYI